MTATSVEGLFRSRPPIKVASIKVEHEGREVSLIQLAQESGINLGTLYARYHHGDRDDRLVRPARAPARLYHGHEDIVRGVY